MGNGVAMGCQGNSKSNYEDAVELFLEDAGGRREPVGLDVPSAKYRALSGDLEEMQVPLKWWPQECIKKAIGFWDTLFTCDCPPGTQTFRISQSFA